MKSLTPAQRRNLAAWVKYAGPGYSYLYDVVEDCTQRERAIIQRLADQGYLEEKPKGSAFYRVTTAGYAALDTTEEAEWAKWQPY